MSKRIILAARYYSIEPLGILYLAGVARDAGWECKVVLVHEFDFEPLYEAVRQWRPDLVGFQIWTGYHLPAFTACDRVQAMGVPVVIGGPHATYFDQECAKHAEWVIKGGGFGLFRDLLHGRLLPGMHFDRKGREEVFPLPDRSAVYEAYPELGASPIKSIFASVGCPMFCTYCYAPSFNEMHGGFRLTIRSVSELVAEAQAIQERWPLSMVYFQDDIFGYDRRWLEEFAPRWRREVGAPFHCQIRLELTRHEAGDRRLDLFAEAGCSGITLAIESGNAFLRDHVLFRHMDAALIEEGCRKIIDRGMTLRTEQILAVPFSDTETDIATLGLNNRINPTMAWTSILSPYAGTDMGTIVANFGFYNGNNDDLAESFFDRSILRHTKGGPHDIERIVAKLGAGPKDRILLTMKAAKNGGRETAVLQNGKTVGHISFLTDEENRSYCGDVVRLQRLFNWLAKMPNAEMLGYSLVSIPEEEWTWKRIGQETEAHLRKEGLGASLERLKHSLAREMGLPSSEQLPAPIAENPWFFCYFPTSGTLAALAMERGVFASGNTPEQTLDLLGTLARRHLFHWGLYRIEKGSAPIAS